LQTKCTNLESEQARLVERSNQQGEMISKLEAQVLHSSIN